MSGILCVAHHLKYYSFTKQAQQAFLLKRLLVKALAGQHSTQIEKMAVWCKNFVDIAREAFLARGRFLSILCQYENIENRTNDIVKNVLEAMKLGCSDASVYFPRVLELVAKNEDTWALASDSLEQVPTWMFLRWIPQLVARLPHASSSSPIVSIVVRIARTFPTALFWSLKPSLTEYRSHETLRIVQHALGNLPSLERLAESLEQVRFPEHLFEQWVRSCLQITITRTVFKD